jgi:hypothetical protein
MPAESPGAGRESEPGGRWSSNTGLNKHRRALMMDKAGAAARALGQPSNLPSPRLPPALKRGLLLKGYPAHKKLPPVRTLQ